jgi:hypothetical protein
MSDSVIEDKKGNNNEKKVNIKGFIENYFYVIIVSFIFIGVILFGSIGLYLTKIAVSDILPTDMKYAPYTNIINTNIKDEVITMNPVKIRTWFGLGFWDKPVNTYSQKAIFNMKDFINSFEDGWLKKIMEYGNNPNNNLSNLGLFMSEVLSSMTSKSFGIINNIFKLLNYLPEWLTMLVTPILIIFIGMLIYGYNFIVGIFYHILNLKQYFKEASQDNPNIWEKDKDVSLLRIVKIVLFCFVWWWVSLISVFTSPIIISIYTLIKSLTAKYNLDKGDGEYSFLNFIKDNIIYKKSFLLTLATLGLINSTNTYLGSSYMFGLIIGIIIVAYIFGLYNPSIPSNDDTQTIGIVTNKINKQKGGKKYNFKFT